MRYSNLTQVAIQPRESRLRQRLLRCIAGAVLADAALLCAAGYPLLASGVAVIAGLSLRAHRVSPWRHAVLQLQDGELYLLNQDSSSCLLAGDEVVRAGVRPGAGAAVLSAHAIILYPQRGWPRAQPLVLFRDALNESNWRALRRALVLQRPAN